MKISVEYEKAPIKKISIDFKNATDIDNFISAIKFLHDNTKDQYWAGSFYHSIIKQLLDEYSKLA